MLRMPRLLFYSKVAAKLYKWFFKGGFFLSGTIWGLFKYHLSERRYGEVIYMIIVASWFACDYWWAYMHGSYCLNNLEPFKSSLYFIKCLVGLG